MDGREEESYGDRSSHVPIEHILLLVSFRRQFDNECLFCSVDLILVPCSLKPCSPAFRPEMYFCSNRTRGPGKALSQTPIWQIGFNPKVIKPDSDSNQVTV